MSGHFTDRDERRWQRRAEEPVARPLPIGTWLRRLRTATTATDPASDPFRTPAPAHPRPAEQT